MLAESLSLIPLLPLLLSLLPPDSQPFIARLKSTHLKHGSVCVSVCVMARQHVIKEPIKGHFYDKRTPTKGHGRWGPLASSWSSAY